MKRRISMYLFAGALLFLVSGHPAESRAGVDVNVGIGVSLPPLVFPAPPPVYVVPGTYVYYAPDVEVDIFFYHGYWYRPYKGYWYRATAYNGPWVHIVATKVPQVLVSLPPDYRRVPPGHQRIPYGQLKKNWRTWERERHWDRHEEKERYKEEKREYKEERGKGKGKHKND